MNETITATQTVTICRTCKLSKVEEVLDFGLQALSNRFRQQGDGIEYKHPLKVGFCHNCGLVQLTSLVPIEEMRPRFSWIKYNEAEGHLDQVADYLANLPGITDKSKIVGLTYKEESLLRRLQAKDFVNTKTLDMQKHFGIEESCAGSETLQVRLNEEKAQEIVEREGHADIVIARHILEHTYDPYSFLAGLKTLVSPAGYLMVEIPDYARIFGVLDYSFIWEEHASYFTFDTFRSTLAKAGFTFIRLDSYPYPSENCVVAILSPQPSSGLEDMQIVDINKEEKRIRFYADNYLEQKDLHKKAAADLAKQGKLAVFGAGHLAIHFINFLDLGEFIEVVLDDHPNKIGLRMPGSNVPIVRSDLLQNGDIRACFSSLSPESQLKLNERQADFIAKGGSFYSLTRASKNALPLLRSK